MTECVLQLHTLSSNPRVIILVGWALGEQLGLDEVTMVEPHDEISALTRRKMRDLSPSKGTQQRDHCL